METTQMSISGWMDKIWYIHTMEYLSRHKKEQSTGTWYKMEKPRKHYAKWNSQTQKNNYCMIPFIWNIHYIWIHRDRKQIGDFQGLEGVRNEWVLNGYRVLLWSDENVEFDIGGGFPTFVNVLNATLCAKLYTLNTCLILCYVNFTSIF